MDIVKGSLDDISRPASASRSRPGSRISSSSQSERNRIASVAGSLEVLTPEPTLHQQLNRKMISQDRQETPQGNTPEKHPEDQNLQNPAEIRVGSGLGRVPQHLDSSDQSEESVSCELTENEDEAIDPKLVKAMKRMKALDEILLKKMAKEKEVKAQGLLMRRQLWEELQNVSSQFSARSHEENVNTNKFLALTPQLDDGAGDSSSEMFLPVFSTQLPPEEYYDDDEGDEDEAKALHGDNSFIMERSELISNSERSHQKSQRNKNPSRKKGVDFIQRNIELVKEAGSQVLLMDDEKLRLEQLLQDLQDGCNDEDITTSISLWLGPGEGYTPELGELEQLEKIEARLEMLSSSLETTEASDSDHSLSAKISKSDLSTEKPAIPAEPGEKALRYTKELREQTVRLKEIDQQLEDIMRSSSTPASISRYDSTLLKSDSFINDL